MEEALYTVRMETGTSWIDISFHNKLICAISRAKTLASNPNRSAKQYLVIGPNKTVVVEYNVA